MALRKSAEDFVYGYPVFSKHRKNWKEKEKAVSLHK